MFPLIKKDLVIIIVCVLLYLVNNCFINRYTNEILYWFMSCYFNDIVGSIAFMGYCNLLLETQGKRIRSLFHVATLMLTFGIVWEYIAPLIRADTVTDLMDIVAYILGGCIYWLIDQRSISK